MREIMIDLAEFFGFYFEATTFSQLFFFMFLGIAGTAIIASVIKVFFYMTFRSREMFKL